jgi:hypothetical protein
VTAGHLRGRVAEQLGQDLRSAHRAGLGHGQAARGCGAGAGDGVVGPASDDAVAGPGIPGDRAGECAERADRVGPDIPGAGVAGDRGDGVGDGQVVSGPLRATRRVHGGVAVLARGVHDARTVGVRGDGLRRLLLYAGGQYGRSGCRRGLAGGGQQDAAKRQGAAVAAMILVIFMCSLLGESAVGTIPGRPPREPPLNGSRGTRPGQACSGQGRMP